MLLGDEGPSKSSRTSEDVDTDGGTAEAEGVVFHLITGGCLDEGRMGVGVGGHAKTCESSVAGSS